MNTNILIGADLVPKPVNQELFENGDREALIGRELCQKMDRADFIALNLEVPLTDQKDPIVKCGPYLIAGTNTIAGVKAINPYFYTLANNHIMDQGVQGLHSTIKILEQNGISYAGVGDSPDQAARPFIKDLNGIKIGIYCCVEHEFSIVSDHRPGANPYDPLQSFDHVRSLKEKCDYVIVLYHGGKELYRYPSPQMMRVFHKFADVGADLVVGQHSHCIGCREEYKNSELVYGQGNFLYTVDNEYWRTALLISVNIESESKQAFVEYLPLIRTKKGICLAEGKKADEIEKAFDERSEEIKDNTFVEEHFRAYAQTQKKMYFSRLAGGFGSGMIGRIFRRTLFKFMYSTKYYPAILNALECETHRELIEVILKEQEESRK